MLQANRHGCRFTDFVSGGNRFLTVENNMIKLTFWLNKGADLIEIRHKLKDLDVLWRSPIPMFASGTYNPPAVGSLSPFFDYYPGGWQEVFPNAHLPVSSYKNAPLGLHGEVCLLPWDYTVLENSEELVRIRFEVRTARTPFRLVKILTLKNGEPFFLFDEEIVNEGNEEMAYNWGHHPVFGAPFLEEGCVIDVPDHSVAVIPEAGSYSGSERLAPGQRAIWPNVKTTKGETIDISIVPGMDAGCADSFHLVVREGWAALRNPRLDLGVALAWDLSTFPYLWIWQAYCGSPGYPFYKRNYNVALEPYSVPVETLTESIQSGNANILQPGEKKTTRLKFGFVGGKEKVKTYKLYEHCDREQPRE